VNIETHTIAGTATGRPSCVENNQSPVAWTLVAGLAFAVDLEEKAAKVGLHVALGGGVLYRGYSCKDLDVIIYPNGPIDPNWQETAIKFIDEHVGKSIRCTRDRDVATNKHVRTARIANGDFAGKRVDFFLLS